MATFQEESASFEHMYAPSRAKALFSKHSALKDLHERDVRRMTWEWKTSDTELTKSMKLFQRRSNVLQQKVKVIEDKLLSTMFEGDDVSEASGLMSPARRSSVLLGRPQSSYVTATPSVHITKRPKSHVAGALSSKSSVHSGDDQVKQTTVRFDADVDFTKSAESFGIQSRLARARSASIDQRRASVASLKRTFSATGIRLTKAKKFELRNMGFYEENERYKEMIQQRIDEYYDKVEKYKEEFRKQKYVIKTKKQVEAEKETERLRLEEESKKNAQKFQLKLKNPFGMFSKPQQSPEKEAEKQEEKKEAQDVTSEEVTSAEIAPLTQQNVARLGGKHEGQDSNTEAKPHHELTLRKQFAQLPHATAAQERTRLLYAEAHADIQPEAVTQRNIITTQVRQTSATPQAPAAVKPQKSEFHVTFESFVEGDQSLEEMRRMIAEVARVKAKTKKARDRSIVPFMSARKAAKAWRGIVDKKHKQT